MNELIRIKSVTELSRTAGLPDPKHPLINVYEDIELAPNHDQMVEQFDNVSITSDLYMIAFKGRKAGSIGYGRTSYDFQNGTLVFFGPDQVMQGGDHEEVPDGNGWYLVFHPDLLQNSNLQTKIDAYTFFSYEVNEALHLSPEEQEYVANIVRQIRREYGNNMDSHTHRLIISNLELLLNNCLRYYDRQFYTRTGFNSDFTSRFEQLLKGYFDSQLPDELGIPKVSYFGKELGMSPSYLSDMLKKETGESAKSHINHLLIKRTKKALLGSELSISEIAYQLGFEHPQSLTRLFKSKTGVTPNQFRTLN